MSLQGVLDDLVFWGNQGKSIPTQAVRLHHRTVQIHPFSNGNGRWARMLSNIWLKCHGYHITAWPEDVIGSKSVIRDQYLEAIRAADQGDEIPLTALHLRYEDKS